MSTDEFEKFWRRIKEIERRMLESFREEEERILREFEEIRRALIPSWSYEGYLRPLYTMRDLGNEYVLYIDLPNADQGSIDIKFKGNAILIRAKLRMKHRFSEWSGQGGETIFTEYRDVITLPFNVDPSCVCLRQRKGMIELRIRKPKQV